MNEGTRIEIFAKWNPVHFDLESNPDMPYTR